MKITAEIEKKEYSVPEINVYEILTGAQLMAGSTEGFEEDEEEEM